MLKKFGIRDSGEQELSTRTKERPLITGITEIKVLN
jgi:hypothetical protein